jgi:proliferating cell nuclear antigen
MTIIFKAKTTDGFSIKTLLELLQNNLRTACFRINKEGIFLRMNDPNQRILIDLNLEADKFHVYIFNPKEELFLGINLTHFHKMAKNIKKKDSLILYIDSDEPNELAIKVITNQKQSKTSDSKVRIQPTQNIESDLPEGYDRTINLISSDFQKACKEMMAISNSINVTSKGFLIKFYCNGDNIFSKTISFGENDSDQDNENIEEEEYNQNFETEQLVRINKIAGLSPYMQIFPKQNRPILLKSSVGNLGKISIYLKSKELLEKDDSDDD